MTEVILIIYTPWVEFKVIPLSHRIVCYASNLPDIPTVYICISPIMFFLYSPTSSHSSHAHHFDYNITFMGFLTFQICNIFEYTLIRIRTIYDYISMAGFHFILGCLVVSYGGCGGFSYIRTMGFLMKGNSFARKLRELLVNFGWV